MITLAGLRFTEPMMPCLAESPPEGERWFHELKHDGYRTQFLIEPGGIRALTRRGHDWSHLYRSLIDDLRSLDCVSAAIDGEVIVQQPSGVSDFHRLGAELARKNPRGLVFMAFDLLHLDGQDQRNEPIEDRRARLQELLGRHDPGRAIAFSDHIIGAGADLFALAVAQGMEGIVSKKLGSRYRSGQTKSWQKIKTFTESELVVIGAARGDRAPVALLARETEDHRLEYAGAAMVTMEESQREPFWRAAERLTVSKPPIHIDDRPDTTWLRPEMRVRVRHLRGEEMLRHATVKAISFLPPKSPPRNRSQARQVKSSGAPQQKPASSEPSHKVPPGAIPTKEMLLAYYGQVGPLMLPMLANRPLNLFRCPRETGGECVFQRNRNHPPTPESLFAAPIRQVPVLQKNGKTERYLYVDTVEAILACIEADAVEFHAWGSRVPNIDKPDRIALDLDPGAAVTFEEVKRTAFQVRDHLAALGLRSFPLLTGGKGIHVVLPFRPIEEWPAVRLFARTFFSTLAEAEPDRFTIDPRLSQRRGRIFLDYLRNQRTSTAIMPWSVRARLGAPVAAPVSWQQLGKVDRASHFTANDLDSIIKQARARELTGWGEAEQTLPPL